MGRPGIFAEAYGAVRQAGRGLAAGEPFLQVAGWEGAMAFFGTRYWAEAATPASSAGRPAPIVAVRQVHGARVLTIPGPSTESPLAVAQQAARDPSDALVTNRLGLVTGVRTADCLPVLLYDPTTAVIGAVHAGWRGSLLGVVRETVHQMRKAFGSQASTIKAALGPAIGRCCYEVGREVLEPLKAAVRTWPLLVDKTSPGQGRLDLREWNRWQLLEAGLTRAHIVSLDLCTKCRGDLFVSFRREGAQVRGMLSGIQLVARA